MGNKQPKPPAASTCTKRGDQWCASNQDKQSKQGRQSARQSWACAREPVPTGAAQYTGQLWFPPWEQITLNPRALALAPDHPAGPPFPWARQILPREHLPWDWQPGNHGPPFLCPTQDRLVCNRSCSLLLHHGPVLSVAPCKTGAVAVSWTETRCIDHQEESWT